MNNNNSNENLFWLVFKNKFLLNKIINHIQNEEWVKYDDHSQIHIDNRLKFKDIHSLEWMIKNKQFNLLNYKLDNNDYIEINKQSITLLFKQLSINNINNNEINILKEILIKLLSKNRIEFEILDLTFEAVKCISLEVLKILINEPYSIPIHPSTIEYSILTHPSIVNEILLKFENKNEIFKDFKNDPLQQSTRNNIYKDEMMEFIYLLTRDNSINSSNNMMIKYSSKEIQSLIILEFKNKYGNLDYTFKTLYQRYIKMYNETIYQDLQLNEFEQFIELVEIYSIGYNFKSNDIIDNKEIIIQDYNNGKLKWNKILFEILFNITLNGGGNTYGEPFIIYDKSDLDWLLNCKNKSILSFIFKYFHKITFGTLELSNYVYKESNLLNHLLENISEIYNNNDNKNHHLVSNFKKSIFNHVWSEAIREFNIDVINYIESLDIGFNNFINSLSTIKPPIKCAIVTSKMINYLNEIQFKGYNDQESFKLLFNQIERVEESLNYIAPLNFIDNNQHIDILVYSLIQMKLKSIKILLNSNFFKCNNKDDENYYFSNENCKIDFYNKFKPPKYLFFKKKGINGGSGELNYFNEEKQGITRFEIIELIKIVVKLKSHENSNIWDPISIIINYFYEKLISIKGITINEIKPIYKFIQENSIILKYEFYHLFWYLHIKDIKYTKFILNLYYLELILKDRNGIYYCDIHIGGNDKIYLEDYLKPTEFTFDLINQLPFDTLLEMLINGLSKLDSKNKSDLNLKFNKEFQYYLEIRRFDLFFKKLKSINNNRDNLIELYNSPSTTLLSNNTLFKRNDDEISNVFKISLDLIKSICKLMNLDEIIKLIEINFYQINLQDDLLYQSIECNRFDIVKLILDNFEISNFKNISNNQTFYSTKFIYENYFKLIQYPCCCKQNEEEQEQQQQQQHDYHCNYNDQEDNIFLSSFKQGDINLCELILSYYPNYNFKITKQSIVTTLKNNNIHIINHFLKNHKNMLTNNSSNRDLIDHFKILKINK